MEDVIVDFSFFFYSKKKIRFLMPILKVGLQLQPTTHCSGSVMLLFLLLLLMLLLLLLLWLFLLALVLVLLLLLLLL